MCESADRICDYKVVRQRGEELYKCVDLDRTCADQNVTAELDIDDNFAPYDLPSCDLDVPSIPHAARWAQWEIGNMAEQGFSTDFCTDGLCMDYKMYTSPEGEEVWAYTEFDEDNNYECTTVGDQRRCVDFNWACRFSNLVNGKFEDLKDFPVWATPDQGIAETLDTCAYYMFGMESLAAQRAN